MLIFALDGKILIVKKLQQSTQHLHLSEPNIPLLRPQMDLIVDLIQFQSPSFLELFLVQQVPLTQQGIINMWEIQFILSTQE